ncbi:MAG: ester cyclase [Chloroflexota bacterium]
MDKKETIRYLMSELIEQGNSEIIEEIFSAEYVAHAGEKEYSGFAFLKRFANQLRKTFPDMRAVNLKFLAQDGDTIVWQRTLKGTHKIKMQGIPPSGKKLTWVEMVATRFEDEKIAEEWFVSELMGQMLLKAPQKTNS